MSFDTSASDAWLNQRKQARADTVTPIDTTASDEWLNQRRQQRDNRLRTVLEQAVPKNPDRVAGAQAIAKRFGLPMEDVERDYDRLSTIAQVQDLADYARESPVFRRQIEDPDFAALAKDDADNLTAAERALRSIGENLWAGLQQASAGTVGAARIPVDYARDLTEPLVGSVLPANPFEAGADFLRNYQASIEGDIAPIESDSALVSGLLSGLRSLTTNLTTLPLAFMPGGQNAYLAANIAPVVGGEYGQAKEQGLDTLAATYYGLGQGLYEYAFEKLPISKLVGDVLGNETFVRTIGKQLALEIPGEQMTTALQDLNQWATLNPDKPFGEYLRERPDAALQTLVATIVGVGGVTSVASGTRALANRTNSAARAERASARLETITRLAEASKLRERARETFHQHIEQVAEESGVESVYIDGNVLEQSGQVPELEAVLPGITERVRQAQAEGGEVEIRIADYATHLAGTEAGEALADDIRLEGEDFTRREAREFLESGAAEELQAEIERELAKRDDRDTIEQSAQAVEDFVFNELQSAGRWTADVNRTNAVLHRAYFTTRAMDLGTTPKELFDRTVLRVRAESPGEAGEFAQGGIVTDTPEFKRWFGESKVVDGNGEPLVVYHGTQSNFDSYNPSPDHDHNILGDAIYFTPDAKLAGWAAEGGTNKDRDQTGSVMPVYLKAERILDFHSRNGLSREDLTALKNVYPGISDGLVGWPTWQIYEDVLVQKFGSRTAATKKIREAGFDAVRFEEMGGKETIAVFRPEQIKSAIGNRGTFDPNDPSILRQSGNERQGDLFFEGYDQVPETASGPDQPAPQEGDVGGAGSTTVLRFEDAEGEFSVYTSTEGTAELEVPAAPILTVEDAAAASRGLGRFAQENMVALVTDADGNVLRVLRHQIGDIASAGVNPGILAGSILRVPGARRVWLTHNHPSGTASLSRADKQVLDSLQNNLLASTPVTVEDIIAVTLSGRYAASGVSDQAIPQAATTKTVKVQERILERADELGSSLSGPADAIRQAETLSNGQSGVMLLNNRNVPIGFVPLPGADWDNLRLSGNNVNLMRAIDQTNARNAILVSHAGDAPADQWSENMAMFANAVNINILDHIQFDAGGLGRSEPVKQTSDRAFLQNPASPRGTFNPDNNTISLLQNADLSTFLHESAHFFLEVEFGVASDLEARAAQGDTLTDGERRVLDDAQRVVQWFGLTGLDEWHTLSLDERRDYHERYAESFERYLLEGRAPSAELASTFARFRSWMLSVYDSLKDLLARNPRAGQISDEVRGVFDRMLATDEQIALAEQGRSLMPVFESADEGGMTPEEFEAYQREHQSSADEARADLDARSLRDMKWLRNARSRALKQLQREAKALRQEARAQIRGEVLREPVYQAWQFLTGKMRAEDQPLARERVKSDPDVLDPKVDSLFAAIAKLGGLDKDELFSTWGVDPAYKPSISGVFGKPLWRVDGTGKSLDGMLEALAEQGYVPVDANGKADLAEFEERFDAELRGDRQYSNQFAYEFDEQGNVVTEDLRARIGAGRLDAQAVAGLNISDDARERLKQYRMTRQQGGLLPDDVALITGFDSGESMIEALAEATPLKEEIEARTDRAMLERHGEYATPQALAAAADAAVMNEARAKAVATEANALAKATGQRRVLVGAAKEYARALIERQRIRDLRPHRYHLAQARAAKAAAKAMRANDLAAAAGEKRNEVINTQAAIESRNARDEAEKIVRYLRKFNTPGTRKNLESSYLDQIDKLLERLELRPVSDRASDKRAALADWIAEQEELGFQPDIPAGLMESVGRQSYRNLTVGELRALNDTVRQIEHLGRLKQTLLTARDQRQFDAVVAEIRSTIEASRADKRKPDNQTRREALAQASFAARSFFADHRKVSSLVREMDGFVDGGPFWEYFVRSMNEAGDREATMRHEVSKRLLELLTPVRNEGRLGRKQHFPSINQALSREGVLSIALNWGNAGNQQRLLDGYGWTEAQVRPILATLTAADWQFVQNVWDEFERFRPEIAELERETTGVEPNWVEPVPIEINTADGELVSLRGGYYPVRYDTRASGKAGDHQEAEKGKALMRAAYTSSTTRRSFTKARADKVVDMQVMLDFTGLTQGFSEVTHDLAWRRWAIDANRLVKRLDGTIREHYGAETVEQFKTLIRDVTAGEQAAQNWFETGLNHMRIGATVVGLGLSFSTALLQPLGLTNSMSRIGTTWVARGVGETLANPVAARRRVLEASEFMRNRARTFQREINEVQNQISRHGKLREGVNAASFIMIQRMQETVDIPTWLGAYAKALSEGHADDRAVHLADQAVRDAQGGGQVQDLARVQRGSPALKLFTNFYSFFNVVYNNAAERWNATDFRKPEDIANLAGHYLLLFTLPAMGSILLDALKGEVDDDDELLDLLAREHLGYMMGTVVGLREVGAVVSGFQYRGPAGTRGFNELVRFGQQSLQGEIDEAWIKSALATSGVLLHLPTGQLVRSVEGAMALAEGDEQNVGALLFGPSKD